MNNSPAWLHLVALACSVAIATPARASVFDAGPTDRVALDVVDDAVITTVGVVAATVPLIFANQFAPASCRWCGGAIGKPVNGVDDWFHEHLTTAVFSRTDANTLSSVLAYGVMPAAALTSAFLATGPDATSGAGARNVVIIAETVAVAEGLTEAIKFTAGRQRPYVHYQHVNPANGAGTVDFPALSSDANLSFPSGHTSLAASIGTSAAMLATLERSPAAPWLWAGTGVVTVATGMLRMISESHYFTDVLGGAAIGAGCGVLFPLLHRRGSALGGDVVPGVAATHGGAALSLAGAF
jgi:membrane-associated phospholipid phosphatase